MKLFGHHWLQNQDLYEVELSMDCSTVTSTETNDSQLRQNIYDLDITANIQSKLNENYEVSHKSSNRIFAINIFSQIVNNQDSDEG